MDDQEEQLADQKETANEIAGLQASVVELRRENRVLRRSTIDLAAENELLRGQLVQERVFIRAMADDVAAGR
jgi:cell division protein FtsB